MAKDWAAVREQFPVLGQWRYLNSATFGPMPRCATEAIRQHFEDRDRTGSLDFLSWFDRLDEVRASAGALIGAQADDIAFLPNAGVGLSWILQGIDWRPGDRILGLADEFPNNLYAPGALDVRGVAFDAAPAGEAFDTEDFLSRIGERTRLVMISALNYASGFRPPLARIGEACRRVGALFLVDGTQGVGAIPFDVDEAGADVVLVHGYKWLCSPTGAGFFYVRPEARRAIEPSVYSWRSHRDWRNVDSLHHGAPQLPEEAARYEGGVQNFSGLFGMGATLKLMLEVGIERLTARVSELSALARRALAEAGAEVPGETNALFDSPIVTARFPGLDPSLLSAKLREGGVAVAARKGYLRVSPHFFNDERDIAALAEIVRLHVRAQA
ncbi:MAG: aminotransferase class V-fold PLP-dependent enzyme [Bryobacterales bacterium]|nr:aminotransferase class V-fold PLP-dependent enzyme [Acidobacteriota bacterium]MCB9384348.1 aminotransferase class V-fold PLP-dependent enzyme [Bryobacterales bacterium]